MKLEYLAPYLGCGLKLNIGQKLNGLWYGDGVLKINGIKYHDSIKPLLRPLSDLTKEIEKLINDRDKDFLKVFFNTEKYELLNYLSYATIQFLLYKHADIFGLIPKGLAIDINTITKIKKDGDKK